MNNFAKHWANLMAKVEGIGGAFCDFARHAAPMAVVVSGLGNNLHM